MDSTIPLTPDKPKTSVRNFNLIIGLILINVLLGEAVNREGCV